MGKNAEDDNEAYDYLTKHLSSVTLLDKSDITHMVESIVSITDCQSKRMDTQIDRIPISSTSIVLGLKVLK